MRSSASAAAVVKAIIDVDLPPEVNGDDGSVFWDDIGPDLDPDVEDTVANPLLGVNDDDDDAAAFDLAVMVVNGNGGTNENTESVDLLLVRPMVCMM